MLPKLNSLYLSHNKLESVADIEHLKECKTLSVVDLSHNAIEDADAVEVFSQMAGIVSVHTRSPLSNTGSVCVACDQPDGQSNAEECQGLPTNDDTRMRKCVSYTVCQDEVSLVSFR